MASVRIDLAKFFKPAELRHARRLWGGIVAKKPEGYSGAKTVQLTEVDGRENNQFSQWKAVDPTNPLITELEGSAGEIFVLGQSTAGSSKRDLESNRYGVVGYNDQGGYEGIYLESEWSTSICGRLFDLIEDRKSLDWEPYTRIEIPLGDPTILALDENDLPVFMSRSDYKTWRNDEAVPDFDQESADLVYKKSALLSRFESRSPLNRGGSRDLEVEITTWRTGAVANSPSLARFDFSNAPYETLCWYWYAIQQYLFDRLLQPEPPLPGPGESERVSSQLIPAFRGRLKTLATAWPVYRGDFLAMNAQFDAYTMALDQKARRFKVAEKIAKQKVAK